MIVVHAMPRRGVHKARPRIVGHMVAREEGHVELIAVAAQGMGADEALGGAHRDQLELCDLRRSHHGRPQLVGHNQPFTDLSPRQKVASRIDSGDFIFVILNARAVGDRPVGGHGPGRGRPDDDGGACGLAGQHRKLHPDRRACVVVVLDLGVGQRRAFHRAPHHGLGAAIELAGHQELVELPNDGGFGAIVHGRVAMRPVSQHP